MSINTKTNYYQRQISLDEVGEEGQKRLTNSKVLVIGAGGLGSPLLQYLGASGVGYISIYDHDIVDITNLHRQVMFAVEDVNLNKAEISKKEIERKNPNIKITANKSSFDGAVDVSEFDLVIDCSDNFKTKFLAHDQCYKNKVNYLQASIHKFEGQLQFFDFKNENTDKPCFRCLYPKEPKQSCVQTCQEVGVLGAVPGVIGSIQASEAIKSLLGLPTLVRGENLLINLMPFSSTKLKWPKDKNCPCCSGTKKSLSFYDEFDQYEITAESDKFRNSTLVYLDCKAIDLPNKSVLTTQKDLLSSLSTTPKDTLITVVCERGLNSVEACDKLREVGFNNAYSLKNGLLSFLINN